MWPSGNEIAGWMISARSARTVRLGVELGPERDPLAAVDVDEHDRRVVRERGLEVGPRRQLRRRRVEPGDVGDDRGVGAEAVGAVPLGDVDQGAVRVRRRAGGGELHAPPGVASLASAAV